MKQRIITAGIGLIVLFVILFFYQTYIFNVAVSIVSAVAMFEILHTTKYVTYTPLMVVSAIYAFIVPFTNTPLLKDFTMLITACFVFLVFVIFLKKHSVIKFEQIAIVITTSLLIPFALSTVVFIRDMEKGLSIFYILIIFASSWISDAGAYFVGRALGKHKLAPNVSPKKTIEGAIGGVIFCVIFNVVFTIAYTEIIKSSQTDVSINFWVLIVVSFIASIIGIFGDLSASAVKRQCEIKDFGNIMPGHGGVIDRFDSLLFVSPFVFLAIQYFKIIELV